jgi:hypothetical protein
VIRFDQAVSVSRSEHSYKGTKTSVLAAQGALLVPSEGGQFDLRTLAAGDCAV